MVRELLIRLVHELVQKLGLALGPLSELTIIPVLGKVRWFNDYATG
ncbi:hypothetical protein MHI24_24475 [Paenibacillus sp. FSL K6-1096]